MQHAPSDLPLRQLTRLRSEMQITVAQMTGRMFPDRFAIGTEYGAVARLCLPDWIAGGSIVRPAAPARAIPVHKLALSLRQPTESVRRRVRLLCDRGALVVTPGGVSLAATADGEALAVAYYAGVHDRFLRLIEDVGATCDLDLATDAPVAFGAGDVIERAIDMLLMPIDTFRPTDLGGVAFLLWAALVVVASRPVTFDPVLARRHADALPPDELRPAISLRRVAAAVAVPYTTALRHMDDLVRKDLVTRVDDHRWTVLRRNHHGQMLEIGTAPSTIFVGKLRELARLGLTPANAGDHFLAGRPPRADFGTGEGG